ncbi:hypothetical protein JXI42_12155 [bacterium]|nr:hypothetical protein [bacterium]
MKKISLLLKFFLVTFLAFLVWAFAFEKYYLIFVGNIVALISNVLPVFAGRVELIRFPTGEWVKDGSLLFRVFSMRADMKITADAITANVIPYTALCFATVMKLVDKVKALIIGYLILIPFHILAMIFIVTLYIHGSATIEGIKIFMDGIFLALLPIGLWFLLVVRKKGGIQKFLYELR